MTIPFGHRHRVPPLRALGAASRSAGQWWSRGTVGGDDDIAVWQLCLPRSDKIRIHRRACALHDRTEAATGLAHLCAATRARLAVLRDGADFVRIPTELRADEIAAALHADIPWMAQATEAPWSCPYFRVSSDMSWIGWVLTANTTAGLSAPLLRPAEAAQREPPLASRLNVAPGPKPEIAHAPEAAAQPAEPAIRRGRKVSRQPNLPDADKADLCT